MNKPEIQEILNIQSNLGRTKSGWNLGEGMLEDSSISLSEMDKEDFMAKECLNCEIILSSEFFVSGCPNCGSKDHQTIQ